MSEAFKQKVSFWTRQCVIHGKLCGNRTYLIGKAGSKKYRAAHKTSKVDAVDIRKLAKNFIYALPARIKPMYVVANPLIRLGITTQLPNGFEV